MKRSILLSAVFIWFSLTAFPQQNQAGNKNRFMGVKVQNPQDTLRARKNLFIIGRSYGDSVVLRWAPANADLWYFANKSGYSLVRYEVQDRKILLNTRTILATAAIKPWPLSEWKQRSARSDSLAAASAEILYGKSAVEIAAKSKKNEVNLKDALNSNYELANKHAMAMFLADQSAFLAEGLGLRYVDKNISKGKTYAYVICALTDPKVIKSDTGAVLINTREVMPAPGMPHITVTELDRAVKFTWSRQLANAYFSGYYYERSDDGGKTYHRRNLRPYNQLNPGREAGPEASIELDDSLPVNYKPYYYRIVGITPFGDLGKPSPPLAVMGRDRTPPGPPEQVSAKNTVNNHVKISWKKKFREPDFIGYLVGRSENATGPFVPLNLRPLPVDATSFTDTSAMLHGTNYYIVSALDTAGNAGNSIPAYVIMTDTIPPAKPTGLAGYIDTTGIVHLHWRLGKEPDLMGYLVYAANDPSHTFVPVAKDFLADTTFTDSITLKTLTSSIYYKIVAFDRNRNPSPYSDMLALKKPLRIKPVTPVFTSFHVSDSAVVLNWIPSTSKGVVSQILYRRLQGDEWQSYAKLGPGVGTFSDKNLKKETWYEYSLEAVNDAGLHSQKSFPVNARSYDSGVRQGISGLKATADPAKKIILLNWTYHSSGDYWFVIYRSVNNSEFRTYKDVPGNQHTFTDSDVNKGVYKYQVKVVFRDGGESSKSSPVLVEYKPAAQ